jgi:alanine racemase
MTHLSSSRDPSEAAVSFTRTQLETFAALCKKLEEAEIRIPVRHVLNTGGLIKPPEYAMEMRRVGHILYENIRRIDAREPGPAVECAIEIKASIAYLKEIPQVPRWIRQDESYARTTRIGYGAWILRR